MMPMSREQTRSEEARGGTTETPDVASPTTASVTHLPHPEPQQPQHTTGRTQGTSTISHTSTSTKPTAALGEDGSTYRHMPLDESIAYLLENSSNPHTKDTVLRAVAALEATATAKGLGPDDLTNVMLAATSGSHYAMVAKRLIRCMIPSQRVPSTCVVRLISRFSTPKFPRSLQPLVLQWILIVFDLIDDIRPLHSLYGCIFYWIGYSTLMPHVCHLLYRLTQKDDVLAFRIRRLMDLQATLGSAPCLVALLSCYKLFQPRLVNIVVRRTSRQRWFPSVDRKLREAVAFVQQQRRALAASSSHIVPGQRQEGTSVAHGLDGMQDEAVDVSAITLVSANALPVPRPAVELFSDEAPTVFLDPTQRQKTLDAGRSHGMIMHASMDDLAREFGRIRMPSSSAAVFRSKRLQYLLSVTRDPTLTHRLTSWLYARLSQGGVDLMKENSRTDVLLSACAHLSDTLQETPPIIEAHLERWIKRWDGNLYRKPILSLIANMHIRPFEELYPAILRPLSDIFITAAETTKASILRCIHRIMLRYCLCSPMLRASPPKPCFQEHEEAVGSDVVATVRELLLLLSEWSSISLQAHASSSTIAATISFIYNSLASMHADYELPLVCIQPPSIVYPLFLSNSPYLLSRVCTTLVKCLRDYRALEQASTKSIENDIPFLPVFNCYVFDMINTMWRGDLFGYRKGKRKETHTVLFTDISGVLDASTGSASSSSSSPEERKAFESRVKSCINAEVCNPGAIRQSLSLFNHSCLCAIASAYAKTLSPSTKEKERKKLLRDHLSHRDMSGVADFFTTFFQ